MNQRYRKGNLMTFPLEMTEYGTKEYDDRGTYLYPKESARLQKEIEAMCDKMEYDGSMMFDAYPDKVTVEHMAKKLCMEKQFCRPEDDNRDWVTALAQVLLCSEMRYRRERRRKHKHGCCGERD